MVQHPACRRRRKESWKQPTKPFGFWNSDVSNAKFMLNREPGACHHLCM